MKALVIGYGSIGKRHTNNLMMLKQIEISVCSKNKEALQLKKKGIKVYETIEKALKEKHDIGIICNETSLHIETAIKLAKKDYHIFLEKPLSNSLKNISLLLKLIKKKKLITMIGCNMRFHEGIKMVKKMIDKNEIGRIISASSENGSYMPDWHPWEDYQKSYASQKKLGGGVVLTQIHEIDYLYWFFGKISEVFAITGKLSDLQIDVEDYCESLLKFRNNIVVDLHLDYFQKPSKRTCKIIGVKGQIKWDWKNNHVQIFKYRNNKWRTKLIDKKMDRNKMYLDEMKYFLNCVKKKKIPMNSIKDSIESQKIALAIKESAKKGHKIIIK
ncbi:MAG: Gfo/Idh/MocA family protein [Candidatus Nitrosopumilus sp. bin_68KS]